MKFVGFRLTFKPRDICAPEAEVPSLRLSLFDCYMMEYSNGVANSESEKCFDEASGSWTKEKR